ncbi:hypothetical protein CR513_41660, partial [Mucuna pruriens]
MLAIMHPTSILSLDKTNKKVDQTSYGGMIDSLHYLIAYRPDIMFSVCLCARFQSDPRKSYLTVVKRIFRYLKGTSIVRLIIQRIQGKLVDQMIYKGMIDSLFYLTMSRHEIMFFVFLCEIFQSDPRESHLNVVKKIFRYLVGTTNLSLFYKKNQDFMLIG